MAAPLTASQIQSKIDALETKIASFAGVRSTSFSDQQTVFSLEDAHRELSRLRGLLLSATSGSRTRYGAVSKGV